MLSILKATLVAVLGVVLIPVLARAQTAAPTPPAGTLPPAVTLSPAIVSTTRTERTVEDQPLSVTVVSRGTNDNILTLLVHLGDFELRHAVILVPKGRVTEPAALAPRPSQLLQPIIVAADV
jgi:hypothetical protein